MGGVGQLFCTHRQAKTTDLETENDKAAMQKKDHMFLAIKAGGGDGEETERERDRLREEERGRENDENGKLAK